MTYLGRHGSDQEQCAARDAAWASGSGLRDQGGGECRPGQAVRLRDRDDAATRGVWRWSLYRDPRGLRGGCKRVSAGGRAAVSSATRRPSVRKLKAVSLHTLTHPSAKTSISSHRLRATRTSRGLKAGCRHSIPKRVSFVGHNPHIGPAIRFEPGAAPISSRERLSHASTVLVSVHRSTVRRISLREFGWAAA